MEDSKSEICSLFLELMACYEVNQPLFVCFFPKLVFTSRS